MQPPANDSSPGELGAFLRARRARTSPRDVGLPDSGHRRTPGLRREEVATLAGVSVDYLVRLEQGRDTNPSAEVLIALAGAMRMTTEERQHLFHLGLISSNQALCPSVPDLTTTVEPTVLALVEALDPTPAFVLGPIGHVLAWNDTWASVVAGTGLLDVGPGELPNLVRFVFLHPRSRSTFPEWRVTADELASRMRRASMIWSGEPTVSVFLDELRADDDFAVRWDAHPVTEQGRGSLLLTHPEVGDLALTYEVLDFAGDNQQQLVSWLPADAETDSRIKTLARPSRLRLVEGT